MERLGACVLTGVPTCRGSGTARLSRLLYGILLRAVTAVVHTALLLSLLYLIRLLHMNLATEQDSYRSAVEIIKHRFENMEGLKFIDQQRVFLLVRRILDTLLEVVQLAEVLFPFIVNDIEQHAFLEFLHYFLAMALRCRLRS